MFLNDTSHSCLFTDSYRHGWGGFRSLLQSATILLNQVMSWFSSYSKSYITNDIAGNMHWADKLFLKKSHCVLVKSIDFGVRLPTSVIYQLCKIGQVCCLILIIFQTMQNLCPMPVNGFRYIHFISFPCPSWKPHQERVTNSTLEW
jgi:hypothetical protein